MSNCVIIIALVFGVIVNSDHLCALPAVGWVAWSRCRSARWFSAFNRLMTWSRPCVWVQWSVFRGITSLSLVKQVPYRYPKVVELKRLIHLPVSLFPVFCLLLLYFYYNLLCPNEHSLHTAAVLDQQTHSLLSMYLVSTFYPTTWPVTGPLLCLTKEHIYTQTLPSPSGQRKLQNVSLNPL